MTTGTSVVRIVIGVIGALFILGALALFVSNGPFFGAWLWLFVIGAVLVIGVALERIRYRSLAAERTKLDPGPGGGESGPLEPRFRPTPEIFVDPTSHHTMRVYLDARTGERRYVAEG